MDEITDWGLWLLIGMAVFGILLIWAHKAGKDSVLPDKWERVLDKVVGKPRADETPRIPPYVPPAPQQVFQALASQYIDRDDFMKAIGRLDVQRAVTVDGLIVHYGAEPALAYFTWPTGAITKWPPPSMLPPEPRPVTQQEHAILMGALRRSASAVKAPESDNDNAT